MSNLDEVDVVIDWSDESAPKVVIQGVSLVCSHIENARFVASLVCEMRDRLFYFKRAAQDIEKALDACQDQVTSLHLF